MLPGCLPMASPQGRGQKVVLPGGTVRREDSEVGPWAGQVQALNREGSGQDRESENAWDKLLPAKKSPA